MPEPRGHSSTVEEAYGVVRADLARRRDAMDQFIAAFDRLLGTGRGMPESGKGPVAALPAAAAAPPKARGAKRGIARPVAAAAKPAAAAVKPTRGRRVKTDHAVLARAKTVAARDGLIAAANATGLKYATLWRYATNEEWKVAPSPRGRARTAEVMGVAVLKASERICSHCRGRTTKDPCNICGNPARKVAAA